MRVEEEMEVEAMEEGVNCAQKSIDDEYMFKSCSQT